MRLSTSIGDDTAVRSAALIMTAAEIAVALDGPRCSGAWHRCGCPVHNSHRPTLALRDGAHGLIVHCHAGCSRGDVLTALSRLGLLDGAGSAGPPDSAELQRQREAERRRRAKRIADALDFWRHETVDPCGTAVEWYWAARGLAKLSISRKVRASRSWLRHPEGGSRPAMIALVEHVEFGPVAIHRTWLQTDGAAKAAFRDPRRSLGLVRGGAVRLAEAAMSGGLWAMASGVVAPDPERRSGAKGMFGVATLRIGRLAGQWISTIAFGEQAERLLTLHAGDALTVSGRCEFKTWTARDEHRKDRVERRCQRDRGGPASASAAQFGGGAAGRCRAAPGAAGCRRGGPGMTPTSEPAPDDAKPTKPLAATSTGSTIPSGAIPLSISPARLSSKNMLPNEPMPLH